MPKRDCWTANLTVQRLAAMVLMGAALAQTGKAGSAISTSVNPGAVKPLSGVKFENDDSKCLHSATENGDPDIGPSTLILKAAPSCDVPWHYHTAEEQLIVTQGSVRTEMEGMPAATLESGGFAMMRSKAKHRFYCEAKSECIIFVMFDRKYDIFWVKDGPQASTPGR